MSQLQAGQSFLDMDLALSQIGDADAMLDMLGLLQDALAQDVPAIAAALESDQVQQANGLLHSLKGFVPIFCAPPLCEQVALVEKMSKAPHQPGLVAAYAELRPHLETLLAEVRAALQNQRPQA